MKARLHLVLVIAVEFVLGCSDRHIDDEDQVDVERVCSDYCESRDACDPNAPEFVVSCSDWGESSTCYDDCIMSGGPGKRRDRGKDWTDFCRFLRADYIECLTGLTCEEWYGYSACSDTPWAEKPCTEENDNYGVCVGTH